jgi:4-alpha-glucanotransferase
MTSISPFAADYRASGLLLHVTSLPSPYGIGDLGPPAFRWIDHLHDAQQKWWQALPLGPTGYGNSPYQSLSSFAGNPLLISPGALISDGLLPISDCEAHFAQDRVDYDSIVPFKERLLETAWANFKKGSRKDLREPYVEFCAKQVHWLEDYAMFRALKAKYRSVSYLEWPGELLRRNAGAMATAQRELASEIDQVRFSQFLLFRQADRLKDYAHAKGVSLIGDLPFFVSPDSSDVWANPEFFLLDERRQPRFVAGVPPDYSARKDSCGATPSITGMPFARLVIDGVSIAYLRCWLMST